MIKKDIKKLLAPDWRKVLTTFIVFVTFPFSAKVNVCGIGGCSDYNVVFLVGKEFFRQVTESGISVPLLVQTFSFLAFFYFLSCLFVLFYDRMKDYIAGEFV